MMRTTTTAALRTLTPNATLIATRGYRGVEPMDILHETTRQYLGVCTIEVGVSARTQGDQERGAGREQKKKSASGRRLGLGISTS